jgi:flagellar FliL protein
MAGEKDLEIADGGGKKKKMIIIGAAVAVLLLGGGGAFFMMGGEEPPPAATAEGAAAAGDAAAGDPAAAADAKPAEGAGSATDPTVGTSLYVGMPRPFVFNVPGAARERLVQIKAQLLVRGQNNEELAKQHIPLIESTMLRSFSKANADDLVTSAGKETLKAAALKDVQDALVGVASTKVVEDIMFTGFVMQ